MQNHIAGPAFIALFAEPKAIDASQTQSFTLPCQTEAAVARHLGRVAEAGCFAAKCQCSLTRAAEAVDANDHQDEPDR